MRVLVCGGRSFGYGKGQSKFIINTLNELLDRDVTIIQGGAYGADFFAKEYAKRNKIPYETYKADWEKYGRSAGYIRNKQMLDEGKPDLVIAFPGGKGTAMMIDIAKKAGVEVIEVDYKPKETLSAD